MHGQKCPDANVIVDTFQDIFVELQYSNYIEIGSDSGCGSGSGYKACGSGSGSGSK